MLHPPFCSLALALCLASPPALARVAPSGPPQLQGVPLRVVPTAPRVVPRALARAGARLFGGDPAFAPPGDGGGPSGAGRVLQWRLAAGVWTPVASIESPDPGRLLSFGAKLAHGGASAGGDLLVSSTDGVAPVLHVMREASGTWVEAQRFSLAPAVGIASVWSLALDGDLAAALTQDYGADSSTVHVFEQGASGWTEVQQLRFEGLQDDFTAMALSGDVLAIGRWAAAGNGQVDLYERSATGDFALAQQLSPPAGAGPELQFGRALALDDGRLVVGAPNFYWTPFTQPKGRVFVFEERSSGWSQTDELVPPLTSNPPPFGGAVAIAGDRIVVDGTLNPASNGYTGSGVQEYALGSGGSWSPQRFLPSGGQVLLTEGSLFGWNARSGRPSAKLLEFVLGWE